MQIRDRIVDFRRVKASSLLPHPKNWRRHPKKQQDALRGILAEVGYADALLVRQTESGLQLIDGHLRAETTPDQEVPVLVLDVDETEAAKLLASVDPLAAMARPDAEQLAALLAGFSTENEALDAMLEDLVKASGIKPGEIIEDEAPPLPKKVVTKPGDLWLMGEHRLLCGDSRNGADVGRLFSGGRASLLFTSPPYAQQRDYGAAKELVEDWDGLMRGVFGCIPDAMEPDGQVLVNLGLIHRDGEWVPYWENWIAWMREQGWRRFGWYVWDQLSGFPGVFGGRCAPSHEFVFHFNRKSTEAAKHVKTVSKGTTRKTGSMTANGWTEDGRGVRTTGDLKIPDSVWRIGRSPDRSIDHPAKFPVSFAAMAIQTWPGLVYEPFCGSGTTIIAAEQLGRRCYAMELEPRYCDVSVQRWETFTSRKAECQHVATTAVSG